MLSRFADSKRELNAMAGIRSVSITNNGLGREKAEGLWGENGSSVAALWIKKYEPEIQDFNERLERRVDGIIKRQQYERGQ